jgi:C1A family cysteine protease
MKKISIHRTSDKKGAKGYTPITNKIIQGKDLSLDESGLLCFLLSLPIHFKVIKENILRQLKNRISEGRFVKAWKGLVEKHYVIKEKDWDLSRKNMRRVCWSVYETPIHRDTQNRDTRESPALESIHIESKEEESKSLESTVLNIIGPNILGQKNEIDNTAIPNSCFEEAIMEATQYLTGATNLGEKILSYSEPDQHLQLKLLIGPQQFDMIFPQLDKFEYASRQLSLNKSTSTEGSSIGPT